MSTRALDLLLLSIAIFCSAGHAHYNLKQPLPYNRVDCNKPDCHGPCPLLWKTGFSKARNTPSNQSATWARGKWVPIEWQRNNHEGGFYRRSLVPVKFMYSPYWHAKTAFEYGCFAQGLFQCGNISDCGTDRNGYAYRNVMEVPNVFPDGDYVFSMVWYGGLHWRRKRAFFPDFHTCAFVRIQGGPFKHAHSPKFVAGLSRYTSVTPGRCVSTSLFVGECNGMPCHGAAPNESIPGVWRRGYKPAVVRLKDLIGHVPQTTSPSHVQFADQLSKDELRKMWQEQKRVDDKFRAAERADEASLVSALIAVSPDPLEETPEPLFETL